MEKYNWLHQYYYTSFPDLKWNICNCRQHTNTFKLDEAGIKKFNKLYHHILDLDAYETITTQSGGISTSARYQLTNSYSCKTTVTAAGIEIILILNSRLYLFTINNFSNRPIEDKISPWDAWMKFKDLLQSDGKDINDFSINPKLGKSIKDEFISENSKMYLIKMFNHMTEKDKPLENCHHIDFNSSFTTGLIKYHPEWKKVLTDLYDGRKDNKTNKDILNFIIGCMHSSKPQFNYRWADAAIAAIADNNKRVLSLAAELDQAGRTILGFNTDGIWYQGEIYHNKQEGTKLGQWKTDHKNCLFRSKSDGAYEFIEDGKYEVVLRGLTNLDKIKPREEWQFGDIYKAELINYKFDITKGFVKDEVH